MKNSISKKQVRETAAGKSISAWVILKEGKEVATVQAHWSNGGTVTVDVWDKQGLTYQGRATGGGYDKLVAALSGAVIDGVKLFDHSATDEQIEAILSEYREAAKPVNMDYWEKKAKHIGAHFANWQQDKGKYMSLYYVGGLDRLKEMGYTVIKAI